MLTVRRRLVAASDHFADVANSWIARYQTRPSFVARLHVVGHAVLTELRRRPSPKVLDYGAGPGVFSAVASEDAVVVSLDRSPSMVIAGEESSDSLRSVVAAVGVNYMPRSVLRAVGDAQCLGPRAHGWFDVVLAIAVLEYVAAVDDLVGALASMLAPGGRLMFTVPDERAFARRIERPVDAAAGLMARWRPSRRLTDRSYASLRPHGSDVPWRAALAKAGLAPLEVVPIPLGVGVIRRRWTTSRLVVATSSGPVGTCFGDA